MMLINGNYNRIWHYWAGKYPGSVGCLIGPSYGKRVPIDQWMPFCLDNDAFKSWRDGTHWNVEAWRKMLSYVRLTQIAPIWCVIPDQLGDRHITLEKWSTYAPEIKAIGWPTAFAVQDGMTPDDVPIDADVVFVGGTDAWKFPNLSMWTTNFRRVHCARVNSIKMIEACERLGCESVDGTSWFRDPSRKDRIPAIKAYLEGHRKQPAEMFT